MIETHEGSLHELTLRAKSSDDEDDDEVYHSRSDDSLFDSDGDTTFCIIQVRNIVYAVDLIPMIMF